MTKIQNDVPTPNTEDEHELGQAPEYSIAESADVTSNVTADDFYPEYLLTRFTLLPQSPECIDGLPESFAIISAYATTGESWSEEKNKAADARLFHALMKTGHTPVRVRAYSPETAHEEPSWCVEIPWNDACNIGLMFKQDAIYYVTGNDLFVTFCDDRRSLVRVNPFDRHLDNI